MVSPYSIAEYEAFRAETKVETIVATKIEAIAEIKDSGQRREASTGSVRDRAVGKGRFDLLPMYALEEVAKHFEAGANKYGERNWEKGQPLSWYVDSLLRHVAKILRGEVDEPHIRAQAWNALCLLDTKRRIELGLLPAELDDLPKSPVPAPIPGKPQNIQELYDSILSKSQQTLDGTHILDNSNL